MKKNKRIMVRAWGLGLAALSLFLLPACYEKQEGCLDINAANFDVAADIPCSECCVYPQLSVKLEHKAVLPDTILPFRYDSLFSVAAYPAVKFRFHRLRYYLSNIRLVRSGASGGVADSITLYLPQSPGDTVPVRVVNDFMVADRDFLQAKKLGTWKGEGTFDRLEFTLGVDDAIRYTDPAKTPAGHALQAPVDGYNWTESEGYISNFMRYSTEAQAQDTIDVAITTPVPVSLTLDPPLEIIPGYNITLTLYVNYLAWLEGLDLSTATPSAIEQQYINQAAYAFYQIGVKFN